MKRWAAILILVVRFAAPSFAFADVPAWLRQAAATPSPAGSPDIPAAVLIDQRIDNVDSSGKMTSHIQFAVRILSNAGREFAVAQAIYTSDTAEVRELKAWVIPPGGAKEFEKKDAIDASVAGDDMYNDVRVRSIVAGSEAAPGSVFGYEAEIEDRSVFTQIDWHFQSRLPVAVSRYGLILPAGWTAKAVTLNGSSVLPTVVGSSYTWELRDLPYIERETSQPGLAELVPRIAVNFYPPLGTSSAVGRSFSTWADVSQWLTELSDTSSAPDAAITQKAMELTHDASDIVTRISRIGEYVQGLQYISIQTGLGRGGGYRPHAASEVFAKSYGDCKDKANLMRAMLRSVGIVSYPVSIYAGDPLYVRPEWPSPQQFNHAVIAVKVPDDAAVSSTGIHPGLGRLLFFDPTDPDTPIGDLPETLQGSYALVSAGRDGVLVQMPQPDTSSRLIRQIEVTLRSDGGISGSVREDSTGQHAVSERRAYRGLAHAEWNRMIEEWIKRGAPGVNVKNIEATDDGGHRFLLAANFDGPKYGQIMNNRLLVFRPTLLPRPDNLSLSSEKRTRPLWLDAAAFEETVRFTLPDGYKVDEVPDPVRLEMPLGAYSVEYEVQGNILTLNRREVLRSGLIQPADYLALYSFFRAANAADQSPVVLIRQ